MWAVIALLNSNAGNIKGFFAEIKDELLLLLLILAVMIVIIKAAYYKESVILVIRTATALFWLFILPGYALTLYWRQKLDFIERIVIGTVALMALSGLISYYLGLIGLKIQNQTFLLPLAITAVSFLAGLRSWAGKGPVRQQEQKLQE